MKNLTRPPEMIWATIPAGSFIMGSSKQQVDQIKQLDPGYSDEWLNREQPQHEVYLSQFEISIYPVTNRQFREFVSYFLEIKRRYFFVHCSSKYFFKYRYNLSNILCLF